MGFSPPKSSLASPFRQSTLAGFSHAIKFPYLGISQSRDLHSEIQRAEARIQESKIQIRNIKKIQLPNQARGISIKGKCGYLVDLLDPAGVVQDPLSQGGFPGINVRRDSNVPEQPEPGLKQNKTFPYLVSEIKG